MPNMSTLNIRTTFNGERRSSFRTFINNYVNFFSNDFSSSRRRRHRRRTRSRRTHNILSPPHSHRFHSSGRNQIHVPYRNNTTISQTIANNKFGEKNLWAALMSLVVITTLAAALAQPRWLSIKGGPCKHSYIGLQKFICFKHVHYSNPLIMKNNHRGEANILSSNISNLQAREKFFFHDSTIRFELHRHQVPLISERYVDLRHFASPEIVRLQATIFCFCFLSGMVNLFQFFLDTLGTERKWLDTFRRNAIGNLIGVVCCIIVIGVSYVVSDILERDHTKIFGEILMSKNKLFENVELRFEISFYLISLAGLLGLIAASCNLFKKPKLMFSHDSSVPYNIYDQESNNLLDEVWYDFLSSPSIPSFVPSTLQVPPPPYTPYYNPNEYLTV